MGGWSACARLGLNVVMDGEDTLRLARCMIPNLTEQNLTSTYSCIVAQYHWHCYWCATVSRLSPDNDVRGTTRL